MGAFDGCIPGHAYRTYVLKESPTPKTKPYYSVTYLAVGAGYYGCENTQRFNTKAEALALYKKMRAALRRPVVNHVDKYRGRTTVATYTPDASYHAAFHAMYPDGRVVE